MKKLNIFVLIFVFLLVHLPSVHAAEMHHDLVALGDSITAGYHRDGAHETMYDINFSFSGHIADAKGWGVANFGITNLTSTEFLDRLERNRDWVSQVEQAEWITLDIGANDFIRNPVFYPYIFKGKKLEQADTAELEQEKSRVLQQYAENLKAAVDWIEEHSSAKLIVLNHYYLPLPGIAGEFINSSIIESNKIIAQLAKEKNFSIADLATAFSASMTLSFLTEDNAAFPIDIEDMDPHPSIYGQQLISYVIMDIIDNSGKNELIPGSLVSVLWMLLINLFRS